MSKPPVGSSPLRYPRKVIVGLVVGWVIIMAKCIFAPYVMTRWNVPVDPGWVIIPTLIFAALVSVLVVTHDWAHDED